MISSQMSLSQVCQRVECIVKDHNQKTQQNQIIEICMKQGCTQSNILCGVCKNLHKEHREYLVSISEIEDAYIMYKQTQQQEGKKLLLPLKEFVQFAAKQLKVMIKNMRQIINHENALESIIMKNKQQSYQQLNGQVSELLKLIEFDNFQVKFKYEKQQEINNQIKNLANQYLIEITNFIQYHGIFNQPIQQSNIQLDDIIYKQQQQQQKLDDIIYKQQQQQQNYVVSGVQPPQIKNFHFSQDNCAKRIKCVSPNCVKNIHEGSYNGRLETIAYLNRNLKQNEGASLIFQINSIKSWIGIGICQYQKVQKLENICGGIGEGFYFACNDGDVYNSDYGDQNQKRSKYFRMVEDQKYRLTFDPANKENKQFTLEQVEYLANKFVMPMKIDYTYHYRIFVCLGGKNSEIELINE